MPTDLPVLAVGICGSIQPFSQPLSIIAHSMLLIVTGLSSMFKVQMPRKGQGKSDREFGEIIG